VVIADSIKANGAFVGYYIDSGHVSYGSLYSGGAYTTLNDPLVGYYLDQTGACGFLASQEPSLPFLSRPLGQ
jgi:hypothetical protein